MVTFFPAAAFAQNDATRDALSRLEESLVMRLEDGGLVTTELLPAIVVSASPAFEETRAWYSTAALASLVTVFGAAGMRSCEACMAPRTFIEDDGRLQQTTVGIGVEEITRLDETHRGTSAPARTAIWLDETAQGVSLRMIDLQSSRIVLADNFDPTLTESARTRRTYSYARELDRRSRGDSITHNFFDVALYPGQHLSLDWTEQWGAGNTNLSGLSISLLDPVLGIGAAYYRIVPSARNLTVGGKILMSALTGIVQSVSDSGVELIDPLLTGVFIARMPFGSSNYGAVLSVSTNGVVGLGISLMNTSLLPFLP